MKQVKPNAWNGHFAIVEYDTETGAERRQEITDEEWKWTQAAAPDIKECAAASSNLPPVMVCGMMRHRREQSVFGTAYCTNVKRPKNAVYKKKAEEQPPRL